MRIGSRQERGARRAELIGRQHRGPGQEAAAVHPNPGEQRPVIRQRACERGRGTPGLAAVIGAEDRSRAVGRLDGQHAAVAGRERPRVGQRQRPPGSAAVLAERSAAARRSARQPDDAALADRREAFGREAPGSPAVRGEVGGPGAAEQQRSPNDRDHPASAGREPGGQDLLAAGRPRRPRGRRREAGPNAHHARDREQHDRRCDPAQGRPGAPRRQHPHPARLRPARPGRLAPALSDAAPCAMMRSLLLDRRTREVNGERRWR